MQPKVFVSHASEDKARFVVPFATALRNAGIDAWVDQWEMLPGDSLVEKIFDEGLKDAAAVIVVISASSIKKPWVREELNASVVARISKGTKIIPVVLEGCDVPEALKSTVWENVPDPSDFEACLGRVVSAIVGKLDKPPLGNLPAYATAPKAPTVPGFSRIDTEVLSALHERFLADDANYFAPEDLVQELEPRGVNASAVEESLAALEHAGFVELLKMVAGPPYHARIVSQGVSQMLGAGEAEVVSKVGLAILNQGLENSDEIATGAGLPEPLVRHAIDSLKRRGHLNYAHFMSGTMRVHSVSPTLRRALE